MNILNFFIKTAHAHSETDVNSYGHHMFDWNMWSMGGGIFMIIFWVGAVYLFVYLVRNLLEPKGGDRKKESALDILKKRYAKGEITKKEFEETKKDLG